MSDEQTLVQQKMLLSGHRRRLFRPASALLLRPRLSPSLSTTSKGALYVYDSLQGVKRPLDAQALGRKDGKIGVATMYVCGPTVYDSAHLGHARTYVHFDVIRRVLSEQLGCVVAFFMNITDVDDKLINRAMDEGRTVKDLAEQFEAEFFRDLDRLGVERPVFSPRATEYIDAIIGFVERLQEEGLAYQAESGSVYFDTRKMETIPNNPYGVLDPSRVEHSEESITTIEIQDTKKSIRDFVLWKVSSAFDDGSDAWDSPWGRGRPGWHSECSAMIEATAGRVREDGRLDIHGGGVDLRFPHHENERSQNQSLLAAEAAKCGEKCAHPWTSFFLHTGHLNLKGHKMSKSLKNFVSIAQVLEVDPATGKPELTARQLRLFFLMYKYGSSVDFSEQSCVEAKNLDHMFFHFFQNVAVDLRQPAASNHWEDHDLRILQELQELEEQIQEAFQDNFDFPSVLSFLRVTVNKINKYMAVPTHKPGPVRLGAQSVERNLRTLGIGGMIPGIRNAVRGYTGDHEANHDNDSDDFRKAVDIIVDFRHKVRHALRSEGAKKEIFRICDEIRDSKLKEINVQVEDKGDQSIWKRSDQDT